MQNSRIKLNSYIFTGLKDTCSGCGACTQVCKHGALIMQPDKEGFSYPILNKDKCIGCGLCDRTCPVTGTETQNTWDNQHCYIATTSNEDYYKESASIGICTLASRHVLQKGGVVFGSYLDESTWTSYHIKVEDEEGIQKIRNSKYLQSSTLQTYTQAKELLCKGVIVLYIGTPCQIAGLKSFLRKSYDNLFTIDLICHGVFSPILMQNEVAYWEGKFKGKIKNFRFRSKRVYKHENGGMVNFDLYSDKKWKHIERFAASSPSYRCYAYAGDGKAYNHRLSCYSCPFKSEMRYADMTVGDPWFISNKEIMTPLLTSKNVIRSLYSVNTPKGEILNALISSELLTEEIPREKSFCQPAVLPGKKLIPLERSELFSSLGSKDYGILVEKLLHCNLEKAHKEFVWQYRKNMIKRLVKKIIPWIS